MTVLPELNIAQRLEGEDRGSNALAAQMTDRLAAIQRNFEAFEKLFPLTAEQIGDGEIDTVDLAVNAATKLHVANPVTSSPFTTNTTLTDEIPEMTITADFGGYPVIVLFNGTFGHSASDECIFQLFDDAAGVPSTRRVVPPTTLGPPFTFNWFSVYTPAAGSRTLEIRWATAAGTLTALFTRRQMGILELRR